jgi:hypothetical protein
MDRPAASAEPLRRTMTTAHPQQVLEEPGSRREARRHLTFSVWPVSGVASRVSHRPVRCDRSGTPPDALGRSDDRGRQSVAVFSGTWRERPRSRDRRGPGSTVNAWVSRSPAWASGARAKVDALCSRPNPPVGRIGPATSPRWPGWWCIIPTVCEVCESPLIQQRRTDREGRRCVGVCWRASMRLSTQLG